MLKRIVKITAQVALGAALILPGVAQAKDLVVGGKNFTEQLLLASMTHQLLEAKGFPNSVTDGMGTTVLRTAMENGQVDLYWEYTGTSLVTFNKVTERLDAEATYQKVKELDAAKGITWLAPSRANNTYALAVRATDDKGLTTLSDLAAAYGADKGLTMGVNAEFPRRPDGLPGLEKVYGFKTGRANITPMEGGLIYQALKDGKVDVGLVFATDGRITAFNFKVLEDDKGFFPNYAITPTVRTEVLEANPGLEEILNSLSAKLTDPVMQALNAQVDVDKKSIEDVAAAFLADQGLL
ncbi:glycine betaine ABC transporter substrate-binding protein [Rhodospirillum sp. A1_3_36]|uniref:glycine betaine ABC transporter substrate-binding protein n=1 Tax=Rhodospirillum sp. A1_3_36 TaxID=3391666 RepID=UPI0039A765EF